MFPAPKPIIATVITLASVFGAAPALSIENIDCAYTGRVPDSIEENRRTIISSPEEAAAKIKLNFDPKSLDDFPGEFLKRMETIDVRRDLLGVKAISTLTHELGTMLARGSEHPPITSEQLRSIFKAYERLVPGESTAGLSQKLESIFSQLSSVVIKRDGSGKRKESEDFINVKFQALDKRKGILLEEPSLNLKAKISDGATLKIRSTHENEGELTDLLVKSGPKDYLLSKEIRDPKNVLPYMAAFEYSSYGVGRAKDNIKQVSVSTPSPLWMKISGFTGSIEEPAQEGKKPKVTKIKLEEAGLFHGFKTELDPAGAGSDLVFKLGGQIPSLVNRLIKTLKVKFSADAGSPAALNADDILPEDP